MRSNSKAAAITRPAAHDSGRHELEGMAFGKVRETSLRSASKAMPVKAAQRARGGRVREWNPASFVAMGQCYQAGRVKANQGNSGVTFARFSSICS